MANPNHDSVPWLKRYEPWKRDISVVLLCAVTLRIVFAFLTANTYDYDEFVILLLARDFAHGSVPYHDFMFFHPPGAIYLFGALNPLTSLWWPLSRILTLLVDTGTAGLVWMAATKLYARPTALIAGLLYAVSPLALISAVRVGQDPLLTFLEVLGLVILLFSRSWPGSLLAGALLGLAILTKYPAALALPVYILLAPRRTHMIVVGAALTLAAGLLPVAAHWHAFYDQTVTFQRNRWQMNPTQRVETVILYWLVVNALAIPGLLHRANPWWLRVAFLLGVVFAISSQVYYHYFVPIVPFAALLAAPLANGLGKRVARLSLARRHVVPPPSGGQPADAGWAGAGRHSGRPLQADSVPMTAALIIAVGAALAVAWGIFLSHGGPSPLWVTAAHLSDIQPAVSTLDRVTTPGDQILSDRFEYPYLAQRTSLAHYFWNVGTLVDATYLEQRLPRASAVVMSYGASSGYPAGFERYLNARFTRFDTSAASIWITGTSLSRASCPQTHASTRRRCASARKK